METFVSSNVILASESEDLQSCPWKFFNHILQYEFRKESSWHELAFRSNPQLISFTILDMLVATESEEDRQSSNTQVALNPYLVRKQNVNCRNKRTYFVFSS